MEAHGLLPDEYFSFSGKYEGLTGELPEFEEALCIPNFGSSEGIYLDISWPVETAMANGIFNHSPQARHWAKRRTIISECSASLPSVPLMLNGRGFSYERNNVDIVLTEKEAAAVANSVELDLCGYFEPETEALLSSALEKFAGAPLHSHPDHHLPRTR